MMRLNYIIKRILQCIPVLFVVTILIFLIINLIPGNPAEIILGEKATEKTIEELSEKMGLNEPLYIQYGMFLKGLINFDLGNSLIYKVPVKDLLGKRFVVTFSLTLLSALFVVLISFPLGYISGKKKDTLTDQVIRTGALISLAMPQFWIGLLFLLFFGLKLKLFPIAGWGEGFWGHLHSLILPSFTQALATSSLLIRNLRNNVVDVMKSDYVDFARSKGIKEIKVTQRHVLRNALISTITLFSLRVTFMLGGSVIIETVFALPGVGSLMVSSIQNRDYVVVQAVVFLFAVTVMAANLITDISYSFLDPRVVLE